MALEGSHKPARAAMGLIILQLHGLAPYGKQERLAFVWHGEVAGILAQPADLRRELFSLNGTLMKNGGSLFLLGSFLLTAADFVPIFLVGLENTSL